MSPHLFVASGIFHPESGGPATYLHQLLPALLARGWSVEALTYGDASGGDYPYPLTRVPRHALPLRLARYTAAALGPLRRADLVYVHTPGLPLLDRRAPRVYKIVGDQAWERAVRRGWIAPDADIDAFQSAGGWDAWAEAGKRARARELRAAAAVIVPSAYLAQMVAGWGVPAERIHVIYNAIPPAESPLLTQAEARARLNLPDAPLLLTAARLNPWKGVDHLIAALPPGVKLAVAGDGPERAALQRLAAGAAVRFLGQIGRDQMALWMRAADYVALYSGYEGLSHVLLESLRVGTPVIASDKGGNPEVVAHGVNGLLVPYVDRDALAAALTEAFAPGVRDRLAAGTGHGMARFDFETMVAATDATLRRYCR